MKERRNLRIFLALVIIHLVILAARSPVGGEDQTLLESLGLRVAGPVGRAVEATTGTASRFTAGWRTHGALLEDNARLRSELERQRVELMRLQELDEEVRRLAQAVDYGRAGSEGFRLADVVFVDHASWMRTLILRVPGAPPRADQAVVSADGVVGRVIRVAGGFAKVLLITDRASSAGALLAGSRRQGIVHGDGEGGLLINYIPSSIKVTPGEQVLTAGIDGVFPAGLPLGTVTSVEPGEEPFQRLRVAPAVDFSRLGAVFLHSAPAPPLFPPEPENESGVPLARP